MGQAGVAEESAGPMGLLFVTPPVSARSVCGVAQADYQPVPSMLLADSIPAAVVAISKSE